MFYPWMCLALWELDVVQFVHSSTQMFCCFLRFGFHLFFRNKTHMNIRTYVSGTSDCYASSHG